MRREMANEAEASGAFWLSKKFWYAIIAVAVFLVLALTGTMTFTADQTINFILMIFGINVGAHTATDVASVIGQFFGRLGLSEPEYEEEEEGEEEEKD